MDGISFSDFSPVNGQTVFVTVQVRNSGQAPAKNLEVEIFDDNPLQRGKPLEDVVGWTETRIAMIRPGESEKICLRWDPFQNAGEHSIWAKADPRNVIRETDEQDNQAYRVLVVRKKADLVISGELIWDDVKQRHNLHYSIENIGEETARNFQLQLRGYRTANDPDPVTRDFEAVEEIAPGAIRCGSGIGVPSKFALVELVVDPDDIVDEETHQNNLLQLRLQAPTD